MRNKLYKHAQIILGAFLFCLTLATFSVHSAFAITQIPKNQLEKAAVYESLYTGYTRGAPTQGGVVTKDYYIFSDCKGLSASSCTNGYVRVYNRNNCSKVKKINTKVRNIKGVYYGWGKKQVTFIGYGGAKTGCLNLSKLSFSNGGNCSMPPSLSYSRGGAAQGTATSFNGYKFKVAGYGNNGYSYLLVSGKGKTKEYKLSNKDIKARTGLKPKYGFEPEGVSVDGDTGDVYISYAYRANGGHRMILFLRIKSSYFKGFTGKSGSSNYPVCKNSKETSGSSSSSSSSSQKNTAKKSAAKEKDASSYEKAYIPSPSTFDGIVNTTFFGIIKDDGEGCGVFTVLDLVLTILTIGIGIAATIGITVSGITYLTAGNNVAKTTKAKHHIYEIAVGLAAYAILYVGIQFLLPATNLNNRNCSTISEQEYAKIKAEEAQQKAIVAEQNKANNSKSGSNGQNKNNSETDENGTTAAGRRLIKAAENVAKIYNRDGYVYADYNASCVWSRAKKYKKGNCASYVCLALKDAGLLTEKGNPWYYLDVNGGFHGTSNIKQLLKKHNKVTVLKKPESMKNLVKNKKVVPGDIVGVTSFNNGHQMIYVRKKGNKYLFHSAGSRGKLSKGRVLNQSFGGSIKIRTIIHPL